MPVPQSSPSSTHPVLGARTPPPAGGAEVPAPALSTAAPAQQPLELILARNLVESLAVPAFLVDRDETLVFYNPAAGELLGRRFEELGRRSVTDWSSDHFERDGKPAHPEELPFTLALREERPVHRRFGVKCNADELVEIEASAVPLIGAGGCQGAIVVFWRV